ncbi:hypothetical protein [Bradyrhizobium sp. Y36]|uniref:hypothetical protein n=1 Tax=Bradyrhizobium sp. Y36 TaxID=2035447 RepID=UPI001FE23C43|nr:hypothetical protein [Bradyrhizobium sp. Y36]
MRDNGIFTDCDGGHAVTIAERAKRRELPDDQIAGKPNFDRSPDADTSSNLGAECTQQRETPCVRAIPGPTGQQKPSGSEKKALDAIAKAEARLNLFHH